MTEDIDTRLPSWSPRLRKSQIARLYESVGRGILDEELIDDVGFSLLARAESILEAAEACGGRVSCPNCKTTIEHDDDGDNVLLRCPSCNWECWWKTYHKTIKHKGLSAGGMKPFLEEFVQKFTKTRSHSRRLILIDTLIHRYHWETSTRAGRPGTSSLIEGKMSNIMPFLDGLNYGDQIPKEVETTREEWRKKWQSNRWKARAEMMIERDKRRDSCD